MTEIFRYLDNPHPTPLPSKGEGKSRPRKHLLLKLGVFLLLGMVVNVAVAWGCAFAIRVPAVPSTETFATRGSGFSKWWVVIYERPGLKRVVSSWRTSIAKSFRTEPQATKTHPSELLPRWANCLLPYIEDDSHGEIRFADARGWPSASMYSVYVVERMFKGAPTPQQISQEVLTGINLAPNNDTRVDPFYNTRVLPIRAIWPGFAINTIFYAALLWMLWIARRGPGKVRRLVRIRRGCCPACGYDMRANTTGTCPECGRNLKQ